MKYYSEILDRMFNTQAALMKAEEEVNKKKDEAKEQAIIDETKSLYMQNAVLDAKMDENDKRLIELEHEYASLSGDLLRGIFTNDYWEELVEEAPKYYSVSIMEIYKPILCAPQKIDKGYVTCCKDNKYGCECDYLPSSKAIANAGRAQKISDDTVAAENTAVEAKDAVVEAMKIFFPSLTTFLEEK